MVDENIPKMTTNTLLELGHNVLDIRGTEFEGIPDNQVWQMAQE